MSRGVYKLINKFITNVGRVFEELANQGRVFEELANQKRVQREVLVAGCVTKHLLGVQTNMQTVHGAYSVYSVYSTDRYRLLQAKLISVHTVVYLHHLLNRLKISQGGRGLQQRVHLAGEVNKAITVIHITHILHSVIHTTHDFRTCFVLVV